MIGFIFVLLFEVLAVSYGRHGEQNNSVEQYIIACRSTDFRCFQLQYQYLRDYVLLGCKELDVPDYQQYYFKYADTNTCVKVSGIEASELVGISLDSSSRSLTMMVSMPVRFQQGWPTWNAPCNKPDRDFLTKGPHVGILRKFAGNATIVVRFPFELVMKNDNLHMVFENEDLDVTLDVPDLSTYNKSNEFETQVYEWSVWAYELVQHVDVPEHVMVPYLHQMKAVYSILPLNRLIQLYPLETYYTLKFKYIKPNAIVE